MDRIVHAQRSLVIFMWQPIDGRTTEFGFHASFAIRFSLRTGLGYGATDLAGLLLRFTELYSELAHHSAHLLNFSYYSTLTMIYGVLIFDDGLNTAYQSVLQRADSDPMFMAPNLDIPMSTWPDTGHGTALLYDMQQINRMITITKSVYPYTAFFATPLTRYLSALHVLWRVGIQLAHVSDPRDCQAMGMCFPFTLSVLRLCIICSHVFWPSVIYFFKNPGPLILELLDGQ